MSAGVWDDAAEHLARERWSARPERVEPLIVRAWLSSPVAWDARDGLAIDGALQWAVVLDVCGVLPGDAFAGWPRGVAAEIAAPIADVIQHGRRIACASAPRVAPGATESLRKRRARPHPEAYGRGDRVYCNGGAFKALDLPIPTLTAPWIEWAVRGDRERIAALLSQVYGLGRDVARGLGAVRGWEITADPDDSALERDGAPARPLPVEDAAEARSRWPWGRYDLRETTTRAPYWHRASRTLCAVPVSAAGSAC